MPVQKSDIITIPGEDKWRNTTVSWKQSMKEQIKNYLLIEFTNTRADETEKTNFLFVSEELLDDFKSSKIEKTDTGFKLTVDDDYVYGQQKGNRNRFLVYHDKSRLIFQHRFVEAAIGAIAKQATDISTKMGYGEVRMASNTMTVLIGDRLRSWD